MIPLVTRRPDDKSILMFTRAVPYTTKEEELTFYRKGVTVHTVGPCSLAYFYIIATRWIKMDKAFLTNSV